MEINCFDDFAKSPKMRTVISRKNFQMVGKIPNGNKLLDDFAISLKMRTLFVFSRKNFQMEINCSDDFAKSPKMRTVFT